MNTDEKKIYDVKLMLEEIGAYSSTNDKKAHLEACMENELFRKIVTYALDCRKQYNMTKIEAVPRDEGRVFSLSAIFAFLDEAALASGLKNGDKKYFGSLMCRNKDAIEVFTKVVKKDLKCGVQPKTVNAVCPDFLNVTSYQRCSLTDKLKNIKYPALLEEKADGAYCTTIIHPDETIERITRNGQEIILKNKEMDKYLLDWVNPAYDGYAWVAVGEMRACPDGEKFLPRKESNGILTKILRGTATIAEHEMMTYAVWFFVPYDEWKAGEGKMTIGEMREEFLFDDQPVNSGVVHVLEYTEVQNEEEAFKHASRIIENSDIIAGDGKREGAILKNWSVKFKDHTSTEMIKLVSEKICELEIVAWEYGTPGDKWEKHVGSLICESECGKLRVNVGGGLTDDTRDPEYWDDQIGKIVSVKFNEVISSKGKKLASLFRPRFNKPDGEIIIIEIRDDKTKADTLDYIKKLKAGRSVK